MLVSKSGKSTMIPVGHGHIASERGLGQSGTSMLRSLLTVCSDILAEGGEKDSEL